MTIDVTQVPFVSFDHLVPGHLVHRVQLADVLVTDAVSRGGDAFHCGAQWPRHHILLGQTVHIDVALVAETVRQVATYLAHAKYAVPVGHQFIMSDLDISVDTTRLMEGVDSNVLATATLTDMRRNGGGVVAFLLTLQLSDASGWIAAGSARARITDPLTYARTRGKPDKRHEPAAERAPRIQPTLRENREHGHDVVRRSTHSNALELTQDVQDSVFFDHPLDHVPGMLLLEAARQSLRLNLGDRFLDLESCSMSFRHMVELDAICEIDIAPLDDQLSREFAVSFTQNGALAALARCRTVSENTTS